MEVYDYTYPGTTAEVENPHFTERSRYVRGLQCSRARYFEYEAGPAKLGFSSNATYDDLVLGSAVHEGMEYVMLMAKVLQDNNQPIDYSIVAKAGSERAISFFRDEAEKGIVIGGMPDLHQLEPSLYEELVNEQAYLAGFLAAAAAIEWLPTIISEYDIISTEQEISWRLSEGAVDVVMMSRPDAVIRRRADNKLFVVSYKTTKQFYPSDVVKLQSDIQALTEMAAVYAKTGEMPEGCIYLYFLKGSRRKKENDEGASVPVYSNTMVRPYVSSLTQANKPEDFRLQFETFNFETGKKSRLGRDWQTAPFWHYIAPSTWLDWLIDGSFESSQYLDEPLFQKFIAAPDPVHRSDYQIHRMVNLILNDEVKRYRKLENWYDRSAQDQDLELRSPTFQRDFDAIWPVNPTGCFLYNRPCAWHNVCWGDDSIRARVAAERINVRSPNHEQELED